MKIADKQKFDLFLGTFLIMLLRLPVAVLGKFLKRDHSTVPKKDILFIKMQGGGSLVIALPALLGIKRKYARRFLLLTTPSVRPFAESLGVFDEVLCIDDKNPVSIVLSSFSGWWRCFLTDTVVDLEAYSRLTTVFSVLTAGRNRIGFYLENTFWRRKLHTHLVFLNRFSGIYHFYEEIAKLLGATPASLDDCAAIFRKQFIAAQKRNKKLICIGHACSEMGTERMLSPEQWLAVFRSNNICNEEFFFLGGKKDRESAGQIIDCLKVHFPDASFNNKCGELSLNGSIGCLASADEFWGIDSALLHYARLLTKKTISFWGPTDPATRLRNSKTAISKIYYRKVPCSPCIHVAEKPPCNGRSICMEALFKENGDHDDPPLTISKVIKRDMME